VFPFKGKRWRYKDPWTHQKNQIEDEHKTHYMIYGDNNGARLVGPPHQILVGRSAFGGSHLPAPLQQPPGPSRKLRVAPPHKISGRLTYDVGPPKVGYTLPTLATRVDDLGRPSKAVPMAVYPQGGKARSTRIADMAPPLLPLQIEAASTLFKGRCVLI